MTEGEPTHKTEHRLSPLESKLDDKLDIGYFADHLADCILKAKLDDGMVISLCGKWGAGKSTVINFTRESLIEKDKTNSLKIHSFNPWWFHNIDDITRGFFHQFSKLISKSITDEAAETIDFIYSELRPGIVSATTLADLHGLSGLATGSRIWFENTVSNKNNNRDLNELFKKLTIKLKKSEYKFLILVDDLDRLEPDQLLQMFRLIKTIGDLPNVVFLLSLDLEYAEKVINRKFKGTKNNYLDKIIQVSTPLPQPDNTTLGQYLINNLQEINPQFLDKSVLGFGDLKHEQDVIQPISEVIETPREIIKLTNELKLNWEAVRDVVNFIDFAAIQLIKIKHFDVYNNIITYKYFLTDQLVFPDEKDISEIKKKFVTKELVRRRSGIEALLTQLFPKLKSDSSHFDKKEWEVRQRICSGDYFDNYFKLRKTGTHPDQFELENFYNIETAEDQIQYLLNYKNNLHPKVHQTFSSLIKQLTNTIEIKPELTNKDKATPLIKTLITKADEIFNFGGYENSFWELERYVRVLLSNYFTTKERSSYFLSQMKKAPFNYLIYVTNDLSDQIMHSDLIENETGYFDYTLIPKDAEELKAFMLKKIKIEILKDDFVTSPYLAITLDNWRQNIPEDSMEIKKWFGKIILNDEAVPHFARIFTSRWTGFGRRTLTHDPVYINKYTDIKYFTKRATEVSHNKDLSPEHKSFIEDFLEALKDPLTPSTLN